MNPDNTETAEDNQGEIRSEWVEAPADSHVDGFQLIDRSASAFGASSDVIVRFKGGKNSHSPPATYRYRFSKHYAAQSVFEALKGADHPGEVVHAELKRKNIPYIRIS